MKLSFVIMILNLHAYRTSEEETINFINLRFKGTWKMLEHEECGREDGEVGK